MASEFLIFFLLFPLSSISTPAEEEIFARTLDSNSFSEEVSQNATLIRVYWHDIVSGRNPTAVPVVQPKSSNFGTIVVIDDPLTLGPDLSSKLVGRARGMYVLASQREIGLLMVMNFEFEYGVYNGSTINISGRNLIFSNVREMAIAGGTGVFRFVTGYVQLRTHKFDPSTGDAIVEYNIYVKHLVYV